MQKDLAQFGTVPETGDINVFSDFLRSLIEDGLTTVEELSRAWKLERNSIYNYLNGRWPTVDKLLDLARMDSLEARQRLMAWLDQYFPGFITIYIDASLDVDGDGDVDINDLRRQCVDGLKTVTAAIERTQFAAEDATITDGECGELVDLFNEAARIAVTAERLTRRLNVMHNRMTQRRRAARPLGIVEVGK